MVTRARFERRRFKYDNVNDTTFSLQCRQKLNLSYVFQIQLIQYFLPQLIRHHGQSNIFLTVKNVFLPRLIRSPCSADNKIKWIRMFSSYNSAIFMSTNGSFKLIRGFLGTLNINCPKWWLHLNIIYEITFSCYKNNANVSVRLMKQSLVM